MVNMLLKLVPESVNREMLLIALQSNKKNIAFDTTKEGVSVVKHYATTFNVSERQIQKAIKQLVDLDFIAKLNKYQYMVNSYAYFHKGISTKRIALLQQFWDTLTSDIDGPFGAVERPTEPIKWEEENTDELMKIELTRIQENISKRQQEVKEHKLRLKQSVEEDTNTIEKNKELFLKVLQGFLTYNRYQQPLEQQVMVHFKAWLKKAYKEGYKQIEDLPILYLNSIKPLRKLEKELK